MKIIDWKILEDHKTPHGVKVNLLYDRPEAQALHITLAPGESLKRHVTPVDVFFFVLEGTPTIEVGDEKTAVEAGLLVESPKNIVHCIYNNTGVQARILVVKAPRPVKKSKLL